MKLPSKRMASYVESHAIDPELAVSIGVRFERYRIIYPTGRLYKLIGNPKMRQPSGEPLSMWWPLGRRPMATVLACEGESDALAALSAIRQAPFEELASWDVCAVPGASYPVWRAVEDFRYASEVFLATDPDEAGEVWAESLTAALRLHGTPVIRVRLDMSGGDLADTLASSEDRGACILNLILDSEAQMQGVELTPEIEVRRLSDFIEGIAKQIQTVEDRAELIGENRYALWGEDLKSLRWAGKLCDAALSARNLQ